MWNWLAEDKQTWGYFCSCIRNREQSLFVFLAISSVTITIPHIHPTKWHWIHSIKCPGKYHDVVKRTGLQMNWIGMSYLNFFASASPKSEKNSYLSHSAVVREGLVEICKVLIHDDRYIVNIKQMLAILLLSSLVAQLVKNPPTMQEMQVWSMAWEDPLEYEMTTHSGILTGKIPWTEEPGGLQSMASRRVGHDWSDWA